MTGEQCHICGMIAPLYVCHTITLVDFPAMMINVFYCKKCAQLVDKFEQIASKLLLDEEVKE